MMTDDYHTVALTCIMVWMSPHVELGLFMHQLRPDALHNATSDFYSPQR